MGGNGKFLKWKLSFYHRPSPSRTSNPPPEYLCPICRTLISEPIVVGSGHTFDRVCLQICQDLDFSPILPDGSRPDLSTKIPNLALRTSIPTWCSQNGVAYPPPKDPSSIRQLITQMIHDQEREKPDDLIRPSERFLIEAVPDRPDPDLSHAVTELTRRPDRFDLNTTSSNSSSEHSVVAAASPLTPLPFTTKPACWSPFHTSSSSDVVFPDDGDADEFISKFNSPDPFDQETGAASLRRATRSDEAARVTLCSPRLLLSLRPLLASSYENVQTNAVAALVNLSLEKPNKIRIVRSGIVPTVIDLLKGRVPETQEHAAGVIFSLSLEDDNKTAIGVLGALPPLLHCLTRSESERTRSDSALALYHLSLVHSNRVKLVKLGAVPKLLGVLREEGEGVAGRVLLVLCQLAVSAEGKAAMLDGNAVEHLVGMLGRGGAGEATRENCVAALYALSHGSMRFKALAKEARAAEALRAVEETGSERAKDKARRILLTLRGRRESAAEDDVDWEAILESGAISRPHHRPAGGGMSTNF